MGDEQFVFAPTPEHVLLSRFGPATAVDIAYLQSTPPPLPADRILRLEAQVERLTRQVVALMRIVGRDLGSTDGT
jgi:hypothetical protein